MSRLRDGAGAQLSAWGLMLWVACGVFLLMSAVNRLRGTIIKRAVVGLEFFALALALFGLVLASALVGALIIALVYMIGPGVYHSE